jgi:type VI secretion system secreted protein Hcp
MRKLRIALCVLAPAWTLALFLPAAAPAAVDMFLEVDNLQGESRNDNYRDQIEVLAFSWGLSNAAVKAKANFQDFSVTKYVDKASPRLLELVASGQVTARAKLHVVRVGAEQQEFQRFCFTGIRFTSLSGGGSGGEDRLTENISFSYQTIVERYEPRDETGKPLPPVFGGWDLINNLQFGPAGC